MISSITEIFGDVKLLFTNQVSVFEETDIGFLKMLSMKMKPVYFLAGDYILRKGDIGQEVRLYMNEFKSFCFDGQLALEMSAFRNSLRRVNLPLPRDLCQLLVDKHPGNTEYAY